MTDASAFRGPSARAGTAGTAGTAAPSIGVDVGERAAPHPVIASTLGLGDTGLVALQRDAARLLDAQAATHLVHDDGAAASRPWQLDPVPVIITADEWKQIAAGVAQRMAVLEAVLDDLYGARRLLADGVIPVEAVAGQSSYLYPLIGARPPAGPRLVMYGVDLVRSADGVWRVLRDATDAPAGLGYALLNRAVLSRLLPEPFRTGQVARLTPIEAAVRAALAATTPPGRDRSRVVVLSGGVEHDSFVEHALLASTLGYHLAEPKDLAVRDSRVWLRSIDGLEPVDVLYRRVEDLACDPLELGPSRGVPGLTAAVRSGLVGTANHLGSALGGSIALQPFLAACAQHLLSEPLRLPTIASVWCGDAERRAEVESSLERYVLHETSPRPPGGARAAAALGSGAPGAVAAFGDRLSNSEALHWRELLRDAPERVVAQEYLKFATSPVLGPRGLEPGEVTVRLIAVHGPGGIDVMPGGVGRVVDQSIPVVAQPRGASRGLVKDVWVVGHLDRPARATPSRISMLGPVDLRDSLPTRSAEALTWAGRYLERADACARLAKVIVERVSEDPALPFAGDGAWTRSVIGGLAAAAGRPKTSGTDSTDVGESADERHSTAGAAGSGPGIGLAELTTALDRALRGPGGLADSLGSLGRSSGSARQYLSRSTWSVLRDLATMAELLRRADGSALDSVTVEERLDRVIVDLAALAGLISESTVRGPAWRFLDLGRRIERVALAAGSFEAMLAVPVPDTVEAIVLDTVLAAHESLVAYRRRYRTDPELDNVLDLLAADDANPRSLQFQLDCLRGHVLALPARASRDRLAELVEITATAVAGLPWLDKAIVSGRRLGVDQLVLDVRGAMLEVARELAEGWFADLPLHRMGTER